MNELDTELDTELEDESSEIQFDDLDEQTINVTNKKIDAKRRVEQYLEEKALLRMLEDDF